MSWRIRQFFRKYGLITLIGALVFTAYSHVTGGGGSVGRFVRNSTRWVYNIPVAGSFLKQSRNYGRHSYLSYSKKGGSKKSFAKASKRKKGKAHIKRSRKARRR